MPFKNFIGTKKSLLGVLTITRNSIKKIYIHQNILFVIIIINGYWIIWVYKLLTLKSILYDEVYKLKFNIIPTKEQID